MPKAQKNNKNHKHRPSFASASSGEHDNKKRRHSDPGSGSNSSLGSPPPEQVKRTRDSIIKNISERLKSVDSKEQEYKFTPQTVAEDIENAVFLNNEASVSESYKTSIRRLLISLKDTKTGFREQLLDGKLSCSDFATLPVNELKSQERRNSDEQLKKEAIRLATIQEVLPHDITEVADGREREKWGVGSSAAKVEEEYYNE